MTRRTINDEGSAFVSQLFEVTPGSARQLTFGEESASLLAVGERGEVYFTREDPGAEKKGDAIWMLPPGGEAREIFRYRGGIESVRATTENLYITLSVLPGACKPDATVEQQLAASSELSKKRADAKVSAVLHQRFPTRYWADDLGPGEPRLFASPLPPLERTTDLTWPKDKAGDPADAANGASTKEMPAKLPDHELELTEVKLPPAPAGAHQWNLGSVMPTPDGSKVLLGMEERRSIDTFNQLWITTEEGEPRLLLADPAADIYAAAIANDAEWAAVGRELPPLPGQTVQETTMKLDLASGTTDVLWDQTWNYLTIAPDNTIYVAADREGRGGVYRLDGHGGATLITPDDEYNYSCLNWTQDGLVALRSSIAEPSSVVFIDAQTGTVTEGPRLTPDFELPGVLTEVTATALDGAPLRGWLALPEGEGPHPLVVFAHGGPWGSWNDWTWRWNPWVFTAQGYAVLLPDPGISTGYGNEMVARGHDALGDEPFTDIMALTDAAVERDDVDDQRQLFTGGSYGGYMANWVAGHTGDRFKGIVTHASLWNVESMGRTTDNGGWYRWMMGAVPSGKHAGPPQAEKWSPHAFVDQIEVPMLVIHGDKDYRVPVSQGLELWMDLQRTSPDLGHQYLYFPDEGHWILKPGNAEVWYQTFLAFLDQHGKEKGFKTPDMLG